MTTAAIRQKLINYLEDADASKVKAVYTLLEKEIEDSESFELSEEQLQIIAEDRVRYLNGEIKGYTVQEANDIVTGKRSF